MDDLVQQILEREGEEGIVIRYGLAIEYLVPGEDEPGIRTAYSDNMTAWGMKSLSWIIEKEAELLLGHEE